MSSFIKQPTVERLGALLPQLYRGELEIARFQRPFVWTDDQRVDLLDSIMRGMPIGSITIWRTATHTLPRQDMLDGLVLPRPAHTPPYRQYILDGLQRVTSLYGALAGALYPGAPPLDDVERRAPIYIDLSVELDDTLRRFEIIPKALTQQGRQSFESSNQHMMPADVMLSSAKLVRFITRLINAGSAEADELATRAERISERFRDYNIAVIPMALEDLKQVTLAFTRINTSGTPMSPLHMLHALTFLESEREQAPLLERIDQFRQETLSADWEELGDSVILQLLRHKLNRNIYDDDIESLGARLRQEPRHIDDALALIKTTIHIMAEIGIPAANVLPYTLQFTLIAMTIDELGLTTLRPMQRERLWHWITLTGLIEYFGGARAHRIERSKEHLKRLLTVPRLSDDLCIATPDMATEPTPHKRFDWRKARSRAYVLWLIFDHPDRADYLDLFMRQGRQIVERSKGHLPGLQSKPPLTSTPHANKNTKKQKIFEFMERLNGYESTHFDIEPEESYISKINNTFKNHTKEIIEESEFEDHQYYLYEDEDADIIDLIRSLYRDPRQLDSYFDMPLDEDEHQGLSEA